MVGKQRQMATRKMKRVGTRFKPKTYSLFAHRPFSGAAPGNGRAAALHVFHAVLPQHVRGNPGPLVGGIAHEA